MSLTMLFGPTSMYNDRYITFCSGTQSGKLTIVYEFICIKLGTIILHVAGRVSIIFISTVYTS